MTEDTTPLGWVSARLDEVAEVRLGRQRSPKNHAGTQMRPYLRAANVTWHGIDVTDVKEMNFKDEEVNVYRLLPGDVVLSEASGSPSEVGKPGVWRGQLEGEVCFQNTLLRVRPEPGVDSDFLYYRLLHEGRRGGFAASSRGVGIHHLGSANLCALTIDLPPVAEQRRIVTELHLQLARVDKVLADLEALDRMLEQARRHVIRSGCRGLLAANVYAEGEAARELRAALDDDPPGPDEDVPTVPQGWAWTTLGAIAEVVGGVTKDSKRQDDPGLIEVPYLRVANVQEGALKLDHVAMIRVPAKKANQLRLRRGDVLLNEGGDRDKLGRGWVWDDQIPGCIHQNHVFRARVRNGVLHPKLLSWHGNTFGRSWFEANGKQTTNLASISLTNVKRLPVPVPPLAAQDEVVTVVEGYLDMIAEAARGVARLRLRCDVLRRALLRTAFAGRLVPANPEDEPADLLLKRIADDRTAREPTARRQGSRTVTRVRGSRRATEETA